MRIREVPARLRRRWQGPTGDDVRRSLRADQNGSEVELQVELATPFVAERLLLRAPDSTWVTLATFEPVSTHDTIGTFAATFSYEDPAVFEKISVGRRRVEKPVPAGTRHEPIDLFLEVSAPEHLITGDDRPDGLVPVGSATTGRPGHARGRFEFGHFGHTDVAALEKYDSSRGDVMLYSTRRGYLALVIDVMPKPAIRVHIDEARIQDDTLVFRGTLFTHHMVPTDSKFVLEGRDTGQTIAADLMPVEDAEHPVAHWGHHHYRISTEISLHEFLSDAVKDDVFTVWVIMDSDDAMEPHRARVGHSRYLVRRKANEKWVESNGRAALVSAYYTFKANNLSLNVERFGTAELDRMLDRINHRRTRRPKSPTGKPVWLIGEQPYKAQDTGLAFFRFMRRQHPEIDAYYVIAENAPDRANLDGLDHIVTYRSAEHIDLFFQADRIIGSHHPEYIYPSKSRMLKRHLSAVLVFLQHGVFGVRHLGKLYGRDAPEFDTDLFIVSSEREKQNAVTDLGYREDQVAVTGLSRFDTLFDGAGDVNHRQILVMPTWREWLQTEHAFVRSTYFEQWSNLLTSARLQEILAEYDAEILLIVHPNMRMFAQHFENPRVRMVRQGERSVQDLLKESAVLVTDYSSVGFDFSFLHKPVVYFQFDSSDFLSEGTHIDMDADLPGPISWSADGVLDELSETLSRGSAIAPEYRRRADDLVAFRDTGNCERIFEAVTSARRRRRPLSSRLQTQQQSLERVLRGRQQYISTMRKFFALAKLLPVRKDLIVFESSRGTQMNDSPKAIYDELVRRGDARTKIWVHGKPGKVSDQYTKIVDRFSLAYFWYVARAKYWVSNQHFPDYLVRRRNGVFLQTWHGTPLKRMMHDHPYAMENDPTLVERFTRAINQWTHLVSPSPFATSAFASAFRHRATVLESGYPRNDSLHRADAEAFSRRIRRKLGVPDGARTVLYAPTFRDDNPAGGNRFYFDPPFTFEEMVDVLGPDDVLLVRLHHLTKNRPQIPNGYARRIIDVSTYSDLNEILVASDALVTDYSSIYFDYATLRRPIVFFPYDLEKYRDEIRGFYLDYEKDLPGPVITDLDALPEALAAETADLPDRDDFLKRFAPHEDGSATKRVVDQVFGGPNV